MTKLEELLLGNIETTFSVQQAIIRVSFALLIGFIISFSYIIASKKKQSKNFAVMLVILPPLVSIIIQIIGSDLARAFSMGGIFALIRFRSIPGDSKDIVNVFFAMTMGLACGVGFFTVALIVSILVACIFIALCLSPYGNPPKITDMQLKIFLPENIDFNAMFDEVLAKYTQKASLQQVKTAELGTVYQLTYVISLKEDTNTKDMIDELRTLNGNLKINLMLNPKKTKEGTTL